MKPLCIDCDGTLIRADLLHESLIRVGLKQPWMVCPVLIWALRGRSDLKARLALVVQPETKFLPFREEVLQIVRERKSQGAEVLLVTASNEILARQVADDCGHFDDVLASSATVNLKGETKKLVLEKKFGVKGFDYAGDSSSDMPVWESAHTAIVVGRDAKFVRKVAEINENVIHLSDGSPIVLPWLRLLRLHQWAKNLLIFVPLFTSHRLLDLSVLSSGALAFFSFSFLASGTYIFNDLCDLDNDRAHATKRRRPLAHGSVGLPAAVVVAPTLVLMAVAIGSLLGTVFLVVLAVYLAVSTLYSSVLKRFALIDVLVLAGLYIWRLVASGVATGIALSNWLISFALFVFASLALAKRYVELSDASGAKAVHTHSSRGRGYLASDMQLVFVMGIASAMVSCLVVLLYVDSPGVIELYRRPNALFLLAPLVLYWIGRMWMLASRGQLHEDPVLFAVKDKCSYIVAACMLFVLMVASLPW
jgi:4-hydroxybenzoate polyprenyltransferase